MDVKDVKNIKIDSGKNLPSTSKATENLQRPGTSLSAKTVDVSQTDVVRIEAASKDDSKTHENIKFNEVINVVNHAAEATKSIGDLVKSIDGIVEQADKGSLSNKRLKVLEEEAQNLVSEIKTRANAPASNGMRPLAGDPIKLDVEKQLEKTLEVLLPDDASRAFGIGVIQLSTKDSIISTRMGVKKAQAALEDLRNATDAAQDSVSKAVTQYEVAHANGEASESTLRDVSKALEFSRAISRDIADDPGSAMNSLGKLEKNALELLK